MRKIQPNASKIEIKQVKKPTYKVGQDLFNVWADDDGKCYLSTHRIRTINKNGIYLVEIDKFTWVNRAAIGKTFSKTLDWGYANNIPKWMKTHIWTSDNMKQRGYHTTKLAAWKDPNVTRYMDEEDEVAMKKAQQQIKAAITKLGKKK